MVGRQFPLWTQRTAAGVILAPGESGSRLADAFGLPWPADSGMLALLRIAIVWLPCLLRGALRAGVLFVIILPVAAISGVTLVGTHLDGRLALTRRLGVRCTLSYLFNVGILLVMHLIHLVGLDGRRRRGEELLKGLIFTVAREPAVLGEVDLNEEVQVSFGVSSLKRHALAGDLEHITGPEDLATRVVDVNAPAVEMLQDDTREAR